MTDTTTTTTTPTLRHEIVTVTPEIAREWLAQPFARQRTVSATKVGTYARAMAEGRWQEPSLDPIAFTSDGQLLNGQHRLAALITTGRPLEMLVAHEVPETLFDIIDTPRPRTAAQFVRGAHPTQHVAAARMVLWHQQRRDLGRRRPTGQAVQFDNDVLLALIEGPTGGELSRAVEEAYRAWRSSGIPVGAHAAVLYLARLEAGVDHARLDAWIEGVIEGIELGREDTRRLLRQRMSDQRDGPDSRRMPQGWDLTVRAFNAWMQGRTFASLQPGKGNINAPVDLTGSVAVAEANARSRAAAAT